MLRTEVGRGVSAETLLAEFDAIFLGLGADRAVRGGFPGDDLPGVHFALPYLISNINRLLGLDEDQRAHVDLQRQRVVVLGGGDTAMDCNRTALRQGAASVTCTYRRGESQMPGSRRDFQSSREEEVQFLFGAQPVEILGRKQVEGVRILTTQTPPGGERRRRGVVETVSGSDQVVPADAVIIAFGFEANPPSWLADLGVDVHDNGRLRVSQTRDLGFQTMNPRIFAGGDVVRGADLVVTAVFEGREAARQIVESLRSTA